MMFSKLPFISRIGAKPTTFALITAVAICTVSVSVRAANEDITQPAVAINNGTIDVNRVRDILKKYYPNGMADFGQGMVDLGTNGKPQPISTGSTTQEMNTGGSSTFNAQWCGTLTGTIGGTWYGAYADYYGSSETKYCGTTTPFYVDYLQVIVYDDTRDYYVNKEGRGTNYVRWAGTWTGKVGISYGSCNWWEIWCLIAKEAPYKIYGYHQATHQGVTWSVRTTYSAI